MLEYGYNAEQVDLVLLVMNCKLLVTAEGAHHKINVLGTRFVVK